VGKYNDWKDGDGETGNGNSVEHRLRRTLVRKEGQELSAMSHELWAIGLLANQTASCFAILRNEGYLNWIVNDRCTS